MLLQQPLEPGPLIATLAGEVLLGVVQFVLVEIELRLRQIQGIAGVFAQNLHAPFIRLDAGLETGDAVAQLPQGTAGRQRGHGLSFGFAQGRSKGEVELMVRQAPGFVSLPLLVWRGSQRSQFQGGLQQAGVHQRLVGGSRLLERSGRPGRFARGVIRKQAGRQQYRQKHDR